MTLRSVKTLTSNVVVPGYGRVDAAQTTVTITTDAFNTIPAAALGVSIQDMGGVPDPSDGVSTQAAFVTAPAAMTSTDVTSANAGATYTSAEQTLLNECKTDINALRADVTALRGSVASLLTALKGTGKPMSPS